MELRRPAAPSWLHPTRRELLLALLGGPVLASACRWKKGPALPEGAIVDRAVSSGHALRGPPPPDAARGGGPPPPEEAVDVLVVGGGVAGLSAAWRLRGAGVERLVLLELDEREGGTARSGENATSPHPWGAHYLPAPVEDRGPVARLLRELGLLETVEADGRPRYAEEALVAEPEERLFFQGRWYPGLYPGAGATKEDLAEHARFFARIAQLSTAKDGRGRRAFTVPLDRCSDDAEWTALDRLSMAAWLEAEGFRSPRLRWLVDYACRDDFGAGAASVSAWAGLWYFAARHDDAGRPSEGFLSWPEGNGRLVRQLAAALPPGALRRGVRVHTVQPLPAAEGRPPSARVQGVDAEGRPVAFHARQVVLAAPRFVAARLVEPWREAPPDFLSAFTYAPWVVANLTLDAPPRSRGAPLAWDNVRHDSRSLGYVVATHQRPRAHDGGPTVLTWYLPLDGADPKAERQRALEASYEDWATLVLSDLSPCHLDLPERVRRLEVYRHGHAMVRSTPGFVWGGARQRAQRSLGAVHFAHADLGLPVFEEACHAGVRAAEQVLSVLGRAAPSWL